MKLLKYSLFLKKNLDISLSFVWEISGVSCLLWLLGQSYIFCGTNFEPKNCIYFETVGVLRNITHIWSMSSSPRKQKIRKKSIVSKRINCYGPSPPAAAVLLSDTYVQHDEGPVKWQTLHICRSGMLGINQARTIQQGPEAPARRSGLP